MKKEDYECLTSWKNSETKFVCNSYDTTELKMGQNLIFHLSILHYYALVLVTYNCRGGSKYRERQHKFGCIFSFQKFLVNAELIWLTFDLAIQDLTPFFAKV